MPKLRKSTICKAALAATTLILLINSLLIRRDYQDSWILEGLEVSFVLFISTYITVFFSEKKISWMVVIAITGRIVLLLLPNLKYVWFHGPWIDQHQQYALASYVADQGHIAHGIEAFAVKVYSGTPFIHLAFSMFSIVLGIPVAEAIKYLPVFLSPLFPLLTYVLIPRLKLLFGISRTSTMKYGLFISSIPLNTGQYIVSGTMFGTILVFLAISCFAMLLHDNNDKRYSFMFLFLIFALGGTHSSSSVLLTISLSLIILLQKVHYSQVKSYISTSMIFAVTIICVVWLLFSASFTLEAILRVFAFRVPAGTTPRSGAIPLRFFELARINIFSAMQTILVQNGADIFLLLLTLAGLIVLLRYRKQTNNVTKFFSIFMLLASVFLVVGVLLKVAAFRPLFLMTPMVAIFSAVFLLYASRRKKWILGVTFGTMLFLITLQLYGCQPFVPSANVLFPDLPINEPLFYVTTVNSVYQRRMILFAETYITKGRIACDRITRNQIAGLAGFDFWVSHVIEYYPIEKNQANREYEFFLIHLPGIAGRFQEPVEIRTNDLILGTIYNSTIVYTNGESYILTAN